MSVEPDLSMRPLQITVEARMAASAETIYSAFTERLDSWFAAPGTLTMTAEVGSPFFFETQFDGQRHPHYGRFLRLVPDKLVELTWVTGNPGTLGAETVVTVEITALESGAQIKLVHAGFSDEDAMNGHLEAWPDVLAHLDTCVSDGALD